MDYNPEKNDLWKFYPSTRESVIIWNRTAPVDVTLATPGTAEDLYDCSVGQPTINLITDPSIETGVSLWTVVGSAVSQSAAQAQFGTNSMLVNPDNVATLEGAYYTLPVISDRLPLTFSLYVMGASASGNVRARIYGETSETSWTGTTTNLSTAFQRLTVTKPAMNPSATGGAIGGEVFRLYIETVTQHNINYYVDGIQAELLPQATVYCDGGRSRWTRWDGTANASVSRRFPALGSIRGYTLTVRQADCYIDFDRTADSNSRLLTRGVDYWSNHPVDYSRISILNVNAGESPRVYGEINGISWVTKSVEGQ